MRALWPGFVAPVHVCAQVRLVGFDGVTTPHLLIHDHDLHAHFATLRSDMDTVALYPVLEAMVGAA